MNNSELLNRLLGIQKLHVVKSDFIGEEKLHLEVESTVSVASCPDCGRVSDQIHQITSSLHCGKTMLFGVSGTAFQMRAMQKDVC